MIKLIVRELFMRHTFCIEYLNREYYKDVQQFYFPILLTHNMNFITFVRSMSG